MNKSKDQFYTKSPSKIIEKASIYSKNLQKFHELPRANAKSMFVSQVAQDQRDYIQYVVNDQKAQLQLYRKKQEIDSEIRNLYEKKIKDGITKVEHNEKKILKKKEKQAQQYNKHLDTTYKRYEEEQKRHRQSQKQQAYKLRKELQQFYEKQDERKKIAQLKQIQVGTQYQKAVERINKIHKTNQQYSLRAQIDLDKDLRKNNHFRQILGIKRKTVSAINQNKSQIYQKNLSIFNDRQNHFIQKYGHNEKESIQAWKHIEDDCFKTTKRLNQFFKKRVERWAVQKKRVDTAKAEVPQKCLDILDKTSKSAFRKTVSTFRNSSYQWENSVRKNKSVIKDYDEMKKDEIMNLHLDLRMTNNSSFKIREKMGSMKQQARKIANAYL